MVSKGFSQTKRESERRELKLTYNIFPQMEKWVWKVYEGKCLTESFDACFFLKEYIGKLRFKAACYI